MKSHRQITNELICQEEIENVHTLKSKTTKGKENCQ